MLVFVCVAAWNAFFLGVFLVRYRRFRRVVGNS